MSNSRYFVDGQWLEEAETRKLFNDGRIDWNKLAARERTALELVARVPQLSNLLDVGCYAGSFIAALRERHSGIDAVGIDAYEENIRIARMLYPALAERFSTRSVYQLQFTDDAFDCVTFKEVIEHIDRPVDAIREINRVLRVGGHLILTTPNANADAWRLFYVGAKRIRRRIQGGDIGPGHQIFFENVEWNRHIYTWTASTLNTLLMSNGFEYVKHRFYCNTAIQRLFPEMGDGLAFLVRKIKSAPTALV